MIREDDQKRDSNQMQDRKCWGDKLDKFSFVCESVWFKQKKKGEAGVVAKRIDV